MPKYTGPSRWGPNRTRRTHRNSRRQAAVSGLAPCGTTSVRPRSDAFPCTALPAGLPADDHRTAVQVGGIRGDDQVAVADRSSLRRPHSREARPGPRSAGGRPQSAVDRPTAGHGPAHRATVRPRQDTRGTLAQPVAGPPDQAGRDLDAVIAGLSTSWNSGVVESHVNASRCSSVRCSATPDSNSSASASYCPDPQ